MQPQCVRTHLQRTTEACVCTELSRSAVPSCQNAPLSEVWERDGKRGEQLSRAQSVGGITISDGRWRNPRNASCPVKEPKGLCSCTVRKAARRCASRLVLTPAAPQEVKSMLGGTVASICVSGRPEVGRNPERAWRGCWHLRCGYAQREAPDWDHAEQRERERERVGVYTRCFSHRGGHDCGWTEDTPDWPGVWQGEGDAMREEEVLFHWFIRHTPVTKAANFQLQIQFLHSST